MTSALAPSGSTAMFGSEPVLPPSFARPENTTLPSTQKSAVA